MRPLNRFGELLRRRREEAKVSMGKLARHLTVSVPYLSDVERGRRTPLTPERITKAAEVLGANPNELLAAAAESRGAFELDATKVSDRARRVGATLMRGWPDLDEEQLERIEQIVTETEKRQR